MNKIFILLFFMQACGTIRFESTGSLPITFEKNETHVRYVDIEGKKPFFLFGLFPTTNSVYMDREFKKGDYSAISQLKVESAITATDILFTIATLGLYSPKSYRLKGLTP